MAVRDVGALLTTVELADAVGADEDAVQAWRQLGLLAGHDGHHPLEDLERARLIVHAQRRDISAEDIAAASRHQGDLLGQFVELIARGAPRVGHPVERIAAETGLEPELAERLRVAAGLADQHQVFDDDIEAMRSVRAALSAGLPHEALLQLLRVYTDSLGRVAEAESRLFHYYVHERLRATGLHGDELTAATNTYSEPLLQLATPVLLYFHHKAFQRALRDDFILHVTQGAIDPEAPPGEMVATMVFADLSGFTPLAHTMGDNEAARVVERFSHLVRNELARHTGSLVKQIGDAFMLAFLDPTHAVDYALDVREVVTAEPQFPAVRIGAHHGRLLYREGDYIGTTVNIAARVAALAESEQVLITDDLRNAARLAERRPDIDVTALGATSLKGIAGDFELYSLHRASQPRSRVADPVCHMLLTPESAAAAVRWDGHELYFCSSACAERFFAEPSLYVAANGA